MEAVSAAAVSDNCFQTLGVSPILGRPVSQREITAVRTEIDALSTRLATEHPSSYPAGAFRLLVAPLHEDVVREVEPALIAVSVLPPGGDPVAGLN